MDNNEKSFFEYYNGLRSKDSVVDNEKEKQNEAELKRANRARNLAVLADLANLAMQSKAVRNGVTKIERFTPQSYIANRNLISLQNKINIERLKDIEKREAEKYKTALESYKLKQSQDQFEARQKQSQDQFEARQKQSQDQFEARQKQKNKYYYIYDAETGIKKMAPNLHVAYSMLPQEYKVPKLIITSSGSQLLVENPTPTYSQMQYFVDLYNYNMENGIEYDAFGGVNTKEFTRRGYGVLHGDSIDNSSIKHATPIKKDGKIIYPKMSSHESDKW